MRKQTLAAKRDSKKLEHEFVEIRKATADMKSAAAQMRSASKAVRVPRSLPSNLRQSTVSTRLVKPSSPEHSEYLASLVNPFDKMSKIPSTVELPSVTFSIKKTIVMEPVNNLTSGVRECALMVKGGWGAFLAATGRVVENPYHSCLHYDGSVPPSGTIDYPLSGSPTLLEIVGPAGSTLIGSYGVNDWDPCDEVLSVVGAMKAYRKVSAGIKITYTGSPLNAQGQIVCALLPGSQGIPVYAPAVANNTTIMQSNETQEVSFDSLATLPEASTYSALEGATIVWRPEGDGIEEWRPVKYVPPYAVSAYLGYSGVVGESSSPCCDGAPQVFQAAANNHIQPWVKELLDGLGSDIDRNGNIEYLYRKLAMTQDSCDPIMVFLATDLAASAAFTAEIVVNYEALSDSRAWSLASPSSSLGTSAHSQAARVAAKLLPISHPGHDHRTFVQKVGGFANKAFQAIHDAFSGSFKAIKGASKFAPGIASILDSAGLSGPAQIVGSIGSAGSLEDLAATLALML